VRVFKSKNFAKFAKKENLSDSILCQAIRDADKGKIDADYGGGLIKQRIARMNEGKSGGYRTIIIFRRGDLAFFVMGFAKNKLDNIDASDENDFKELAKYLLSAPTEKITQLLDNKKFIEVEYNEKI